MRAAGTPHGKAPGKTTGKSPGKSLGKTGARRGSGAAGSRPQRAGSAARLDESRPRPQLGAAVGSSDAAVRPPSGLGWRGAIAATVAGLGYELVEVERAQRGLLRIFIDRVPGRAYDVAGEFVTVDDCEQVTRQLQYVLEVEALDYARLEVSSPGLDRPLKTEADFQRFAGLAVSVTLKAPFQGRKVWQGVLTAVASAAAAAGELGDGGWSLVFQHGKAEQVFGFRFDEVREARLVPVVDFKGRKSAGTAPGGGTQAAAVPEPAAAASADERRVS